MSVLTVRRVRRRLRSPPRRTARASPLTHLAALSGLSQADAQAGFDRLCGKTRPGGGLIEANLRYALSSRDIERCSQRVVPVDERTIDCWVLAYAPAIKRRLRRFRKPHRESVRVDETQIRVPGRR